MKGNIKTYFVVWLLMSVSMSVFCQNLDKVGSKDMVRVTGGLNYNSIFYNADGIASRRDPFTWYLNGNVNINILDVSLPFTYSYSNQHGTYTQPFNMTSFAPTYKWIKGYAGFNSMNFSNYTLAGHVFLGGGIELTPKNWKIAAMYGRLKKASEYDAINLSDANMSYKRMGYGAKVGYEKNGNGLSLVYFTAKDDPNSLKFIPDNTQIQPQENTVVSVIGKTKITKRISLNGEYALSGLTRNTFGDPMKNGEMKNQLPLIFQPKSTSQFFSAYKASIAYTQDVFSLSLNYERVAPDYKTLGAYYFNNDLENITLAPSLRLIKNKLNMGLNAGFQRNNLDKSKISTTRRLVGSANISFAPNAKWNFNATYSNFNSYTNMRPKTDPYYQQTPADTLNFYQLSQNAFASAIHNFGKGKVKHTIMLTSGYQVTAETQGTVKVPSTKVFNGNASYNLTFTKTKTNTAILFNYNETQSVINKTVYAGPGISIGQAFAKNKLRASVGSIYNQSLTNNQKSSVVLNNRFSLAYTPKLDKKFGKPSLSLNAVYIRKIKTELQTQGYGEFTGTVNLSYGF